MPLHDLVHYFNGAAANGDSTLYVADGRVAAWHDGLRLTSLFQPVRELASGRIVGHRATLGVEQDDGPPISGEAAYARCRDDETVVRFDRLCRTVHALNFLAQRQHAGGYVQMDVHPRHLLAVPSQHGLVFEAVLKRCGLAPEDIVLTVDLGVALERPRLAAALESYRQRGYRLALRGLPAAEAGAWPAALVEFPAGSPAVLDDAARAAGCRLQWSAVDDAAATVAARLARVDLILGDFLGAARRDCLPTHEARRVA